MVTWRNFLPLTNDLSLALTGKWCVRIDDFSLSEHICPRNLCGGNHRKVPHPHQIAGGRSEGKDPANFEDSPMPRLAQHSYRL
jgi:hypothetical protein